MTAAGDACPQCTRAQTNPFHGGLIPGCRGCEVRRISNAPQHVRYPYYDSIADEHERSMFQQAVGTERKRRAALVAEREQAA